MIYRILDFTPGEPHWDTAIVEAESPEKAKDILKAYLDERVAADDLPETVWEWDASETTESWRVAEARGPLLFLIGSGCR